MLRQITHDQRGRQIFGIYFGAFVPLITLGAAVLAFRHSWWLGAVTVALHLAWIVETGRTTCRRCWAYGTTGCGLPSLAAPLFGPRLPAITLTHRRIRIHHAVDIVGAVYLNVWYAWLWPTVWPLVLAWTIGAWWMVSRPKRFHGVLYRLRSEHLAGGTRRVSLAVLDSPRPATTRP